MFLYEGSKNIFLYNIVFVQNCSVRNVESSLYLANTQTMIV